MRAAGRVASSSDCLCVLSGVSSRPLRFKILVNSDRGPTAFNREVRKERPLRTLRNLFDGLEHCQSGQACEGRI